MQQKGYSRKGKRRAYDHDEPSWGRPLSQPLVSVRRAQDISSQMNRTPREQVVRLDVPRSQDVPAWAVKELRYSPASGLLDVPVVLREKQQLQQRVKETRWIWSSIGAVVAFLLMALGVLHWRSSLQQRGVADFFPQYEMVEEHVDTRSPVYFFDHDREATIRQARECWNRYAEAVELAQILPLVARSRQIEPVLRRHWKPALSGRMNVLDPQFIVVSGQTQGRGFFQVQGADENGRPYCAYFVEEDGKLKLDWEASTGFCPIAFADMENAALVEPATLRVVVARADYYNPTFPEERYASYRLTDAADRGLLWGYVLRGSAAHQALERLTGNANSLLVEETIARVTLKLQRLAGHKIKNQFLITEMLHNDWVMP